MPNAAFSRSCAAWLAELRPEPPRRILPGSAFAALTKSWKVLMRALLRHHQRVRRVVEPEHRRDVLGLVLHLAFDRLEHDMRQVDADDVEAVARERVHLRPHETAARARLVLDDGLDRRAVLLQHHLLVARREVRFAAGREGLPVEDVLVRAGLRGRPRSQQRASTRLRAVSSCSVSTVDVGRRREADASRQIDFHAASFGKSGKYSPATPKNRGSA